MSKIIQCSVSKLKELGVTVTPYLVGELQQLAIVMAGKPYVHIYHPDGQKLTIPVSQLEQLVESISHFDPEDEVLLIFQEHSGYCVFQYPDRDGGAETFSITNQLPFKEPESVN